jgi:HEPN domain-containing protein
MLPELQILLDDCKFLNRYYIDTRYPVHWPTSYDKEETQKAKLAAEHIRDTIKNKLRDFLEMNHRLNQSSQ